MHVEQVNHPGVGRPLRRWAMFAFLGLLVLWALDQASVSILFPTTIAGGQVVQRTTEVVWRTLVPATLTLVAAGAGLWFESRRQRWHSRFCLAVCAVTGLVTVVPTILSVVGLLVTPRD